MKLEAVTCCVDYSDFLAATLPTNRGLFDRLVVVTAPEDLDTQRLCEFWNVQCVPTDAFNTRWGDFDKARGVNEGLGELDGDGWMLHLDSDIFLPPLTRKLLETAELDPTFVYGVDRHEVSNAHDWLEQVAMPALQQEDDIYVHLNSYPLSPRVATSRHGGYVPIGFFQLWHPTASGVDAYPVEHANAGRTDMMFGSQWPRARRALLPEVVAYHLTSEDAPQGANWNGRSTRPFWDGLTPGSDGRRPHGHRHRHHHHHHRRPQPDPYCVPEPEN